MSLARSVIFNIIGKDSASPAFLSASKAAETAATRIERTAARIQKSGAVMQAAGVKMSKAITLPVVAATAVAVDQAAKFQKSMNTIQVATDQSNRAIALGGKGLQKIAVETGQSLSQLSDSLYTATKSGMPMAKALKVVEASAKGAAAEGADLGVATQALTSITASYGKSLDNPVKAENELIRGAGLAKTTYQDFASSLANVVPLASSLGISFAQVAGAEDTMTQHGETAQRASENLANLITNLAGQNNVASKSLQQLGVDTIDLSKNLGKRGLTGSLDDVLAAINKHRKDGVIVTSAFKQAAVATASLNTEISKLPKSMQANAQAFAAGTMSYKDFYSYAKSLGGQQYAMAKDLITTQRAAQGFNKQLTSGNSTVSTLARTLQKALGGVTGMRVALMLSGNSAKTFKNAVNEISDAAVKSGADILGWAKTQATADNKMKRAKESLQVLAVEIGTALIPVVLKVTDAVSKAVHWFESLSSTDKKFIGYSVVVLAALGPVLAIVGRITKAVGLLTRAFGVMWAAGGAVGRFTAGMREVELSLAAMETKAYAAGLKLRAVGVAATGLGSALGGAAIGYGVGSLTANASTATKAIGILGSTAAGAALGFKIGGPLGAGIGAISGGLTDAVTAFHLFGGAAKAQIKPTQAFTQAILADNDALGKNTRSLVENSLQSKGAYDAALKLGINQKTLTDAMMGNAGALAKVQAAQLGVTSAIGYGTTATSHLTKAQKAQIDANSKLSDVIGFVSQTLKVNQRAANNIAAANGKQAKSADAVASSTSKAASATQAAASKGNTYLGVLAKLAEDHKVKVSANVLNALEGIRRVAVELGGLHGKTIVVKSIYSSTGKVTMKAAGGLITGPGSGTSDSIPARLSNGEFVVNARQAGKHRALLDAINSGAHGFAAGGTVGGSFTVNGTQYASQRAADNAVSRAMRTLADQLPRFVSALGRSTDQLKSAEQTLIKDLKNASASQAQLAAIRLDFSRLNDLAKQRDRISAELGTKATAQTAYEKLSAVADKFAQIQSSVAQAAMGGFDVGTAGNIDTSASWVQARLAMGMAVPTNAGASGVISSVQAQLAQTEKFKSQLDKLKHEGLSKSIWQQLAGEGPAQAGATVAALAAGSKAQIKQLSGTYGQLQSVGNALGTEAAKDAEGAQLKAAQDMVAELKKERQALVNELRSLGKRVDTIGSQVAGALNGTAHSATARARGKQHS